MRSMKIGPLFQISIVVLGLVGCAVARLAGLNVTSNASRELRKRRGRKYRTSVPNTQSDAGGCKDICGCKTDVVIIGAGFAGLAAAKRLKDVAEETNSELDFVIIESSDRVGGRVKSNKDRLDTTVEECANWVFNGNPIFDLVRDYGYNITQQDFFDNEIWQYDEMVVHGMAERIPDLEVKKTLREFRQDPYRCLLRGGRDYFWPNPQPIPGSSLNYGSAIEYAKSVCAWETETNQDFFNWWLYVNFEFASDTIAMVELFDPYVDHAYMMVDQNGFDGIAQRFVTDNGLMSYIKAGERVTNINYGINDGSDVRAKVTVNKGGNECVYSCKRVILAVPAGTLNNELITFDPPLDYPEKSNNPFRVGDYIKVFYEFTENFWGTDRQFIVSLQENDNKGWCHHYQNLDAKLNGKKGLSTSKFFVKNSHILICTLIGQAFRDLVDGATGMISDSTLTGLLLDPLRRIHGSDVNKYFKDVYYPKQNLDVDYGFGSYATWAPTNAADPVEGGYTFDNYFKFYGMGPNVARCDLVPVPHNGCSGGEWILHFSGTCSCYEFNELVHGAYWAGERSANFVLRDLIGDDIFLGRSYEFPDGPCEDFFLNWVPP